MRRIWQTYFSLFVVALIIIGLDQFSKALVRNWLSVGEVWSPWEWLTPFARIVNWYNSGVAFGMFQGFGQVFMVLAIIVALVIIYYYPQMAKQTWYVRLAMGMLLGGAVGNLIDRLVFAGHVTDFISIGNFPVFNLADSSITIGVAIMLLAAWLQNRRNRGADSVMTQKESTEDASAGGASTL